VSYLRELHGNTAGAIEAMQKAAGAGVPGTEAWLWTQTQLGNLYFNSGDLLRAEDTYREALYFRSDYAYAVAGLARMQAARGDYSGAIEATRPIVERLPLPEFVILLGELYEVIGQRDAAAQQYDLVRVIQQLYASGGVDVDLELALFDANRGHEPAATLARARRAFARRPGIYAADVLAWALYQTGDYQEAQTYSQQALRLGTQDALLFFHAGMIANRLGETAQARQYLERALMINPHFSILYADHARQVLEELHKTNETTQHFFIDFSGIRSNENRE